MKSNASVLGDGQSLFSEPVGGRSRDTSKPVSMLDLGSSYPGSILGHALHPDRCVLSLIHI